MATYHVSLAGSNTAPYDTWAKAATNIPQVLIYIVTDGSGSNTVLVDPGTYIGPDTKFINIVNAKLASLSIIGSLFGESVGVEASRDLITFQAYTGNTCAYIAQSDVTIANCVLKSDPDQYAFWNDGGANYALNNVVVDGASLQTGADFIFNRILFVGDASLSKPNAVRCSGASNGVFYYPVITGGAGLAYVGMSFSASGKIDVINPTILNCKNSGIYHSGTGELNVWNPLVGGTSAGYSVAPIDSVGSGDLNVYNGGILNGGYVPTAFIAGATIESNIKENPNLILGAPKRQGYIVPSVDDAGRLYYAEDLAEVLDTYGFKGTFYLEVGTWIRNYPGLNPDLRTLIENGVMEVGNHSWSHSPAVATTGMTVSYTGADTNPTVALVAGTPRNIQLRTTEGNDNADINLTVNPSFGDIKTVIDALIVWSATLTDLVSIDAKATSLDVISAQAAPYALLFLRTDETEGYFKNECVDSKTELDALVNALGDVTDGQTGLTYSCKSFAAPYTYGDPDYRAALKVAGHSSFRVGSHRLGLFDLDHYALSTISANIWVVPGDKAATQVIARAMCQNASVAGLVFCLYTHSELEVTLEQWGWLLDIFAEFSNITVTSTQLAIADILDKADSYDEPTGISVRTFTPQTDFSILKNSECINAGLNDPFLINGTPGADLVVNGDFATDTVWSKGVGWSIVGGVAVCDGTQTNARSVYQDVGTSKSLFKVTWDLVSQSAGSASSKFRAGGDQGPSQTVPGTYIDYLYQAQNGDIAIEGDVDFVGSIDNVICEAMIGVTDIKDIVGNPITDESGNIVASGDIVDIGAFEHQQLLPSDINIISQQEYAGITLYIIPSNNMKPIEED